MGTYCPVDALEPITCPAGNYCPVFWRTPCPAGKFGSADLVGKTNETEACPGTCDGGMVGATSRARCRKDSCAWAQNLCDLVVPHSDTTADGFDTLSSCGFGKEKVFYADVAAGATIAIQQTTNDFDSMHETRWGNSTCPGSTSVECTDFPEEKVHSWTNDQGSARRAPTTGSAQTWRAARTPRATTRPR